MSQKSTGVKIDTKAELAQEAADFVTTLPESKSPLLQIVKDIDASDIPTAQSFIQSKIENRCAVQVSDFPNPNLATLIGDKYAAELKEAAKPDETLLAAAQFFQGIDDILWLATGIVGGLITTAVAGAQAGALAAGGIKYLGERSTANFDKWVEDLEADLAAGRADPVVINQLAFIAGEPSLLLELTNTIDQIPQNELWPYLNNCIAKRNIYKNYVIPAYPSVIFDNNPKLMAKTYYALAMMDYSVQIVCGRILASYDETVFIESNAPISVAPEGSSLPSETSSAPSGLADGSSGGSSGGGGGKDGGVLPILAILGIGAAFFL